MTKAEFANTVDPGETAYSQLKKKNKEISHFWEKKANGKLFRGETARKRRNFLAKLKFLSVFCGDSSFPAKTIIVT